MLFATRVLTSRTCAWSPWTRDDVTGHIFFSKATLESGHAVLALAPMAVLPELQRAGVGSALIRAALRRAAETSYPLVVVLGHAEYYPRFGFEPGHMRGIRSPYEVPPEAWMVHLLPAYGPQVSGLVALRRAVRPCAVGLYGRRSYSTTPAQPSEYRSIARAVTVSPAWATAAGR